nr:proline dehydrogenase [Colletotrichum truncatum]KAF6786693.1 proline dehydrogenase [Colletotrichum truncatum]
MGIDGVVLAFAREATASQAVTNAQLTKDEPQLRDWVSCNLETVDKLQGGDYLAIRCTGAGKATLRVLEDFSRTAQTVSLANAVELFGPQLSVFRDAMHEICSAAHAKKIRILIDAEDVKHQNAIDYVALNIMSKLNCDGRTCVFNTYQMYLKSGLTKLRTHLNYSSDKNFNLGIKLVRGAYLHTEPERALLQDSKKATDVAYDTAVKFLISPSASGKPWSADVMLATHNSESAWKAMSLYTDLVKSKTTTRGGVKSLAFAQLMGMADEVSLKLVSEIKRLGLQTAGAGGGKANPFPAVGVYKYSVWGSLEECLLYMLRRAEENKDAVARSRQTARAMILELFMRALPVRRQTPRKSLGS